jgi:hypothetical protein
MSAYPEFTADTGGEGALADGGRQVRTDGGETDE